ncbi:MAG: aminofutalosine synthase MqnE [Armatimonadota bacterium]|nr:aminofutalosine synthase MqnE [bacterium]
MIDQIIEKSDVGDVLRKALDGQRLSVEDGVRLFESDDIHVIGAVANEIRRRINGNRTYYVVNRHINYTDICKNRCTFCAYSRDMEDPDAYAMSVGEVLERAEEYYEQIKFTELHIVGGLHPTLPFEYYTEMLSTLKGRFPEVHIQAFTAVEIVHISEVAGLSVTDTLSALKDAGLGSLPGGGAEVFSPRVRGIVCPEKMPGTKWLQVMREAHKLGIKTNSTMLYGHVETYKERVEHMVTLRELQDETGGFMTFIPLKFHPENTRLAHLAVKPNSIDDLKIYSIGRLMIDNIPHVKVFWIMLGIKFAQVALSYGADDFDGTVIEEKITHRAGATTPQGLTVADLLAHITETGTTPVERDTVYNEVTRNAIGMPAIS